MIAYFEVSVGELVGVKELQSSQTLSCYWLYLTQRIALVFVDFHEVIKTFSQSLEN